MGMHKLLSSNKDNKMTGLYWREEGARDLGLGPGGERRKNSAKA